MKSKSSKQARINRHVGVRGWRDQIFDGLVYAILFLVAASILLPMLFVISASLTPYSEVIRNGGFLIFPKIVSFEAYDVLLRKSTLAKSFQVSGFITGIGTVLNIVFTALMAYPLSKKRLPGRKFFINMIILTLMFNGGIVPTYRSCE